MTTRYEVKRAPAHNDGPHLLRYAIWDRALGRFLQENGQIVTADTSAGAELLCATLDSRCMTLTEMWALAPGDIIESAAGATYIVSGNYGHRVTAVQTADVMNHTEWRLVRKAR